MKRFLGRSTTFIIVLALIMVAAVALRVLAFKNITFFYDQARDIFESQRIITSGDFIKIQGPMTDIPGVFHGPLYWYIIAPFVYLMGGLPYAAKAFLIILNVLCIPVLYWVTMRMTKQRNVALVAACLFAVSFEAIQYGRWMSNPAPALLPILVSLYGLWCMTQKNIKGVLYFLLSWPLSVQFQFFMVYHGLFFIILFLWNFRLHDVRTHWKLLLMSLGGSILLFSPFIVGLFKYRFIAITNLLQHVAEKEGGGLTIQSFGQKVWGYIVYSADPFAYNILSIQVDFRLGLFLLFLAVSVWWAVRSVGDKSAVVFSLFWIAAPLVIYFFGSLNAYFLTMGNLYGYLLIAAIMIVRLSESPHRVIRATGMLIFLLVIGSNLMQVWQTYAKGETLFAIQKGNILTDVERVVDHIYAEANDQPFAINTVTNPLFMNTTWAYAFTVFGEKKHGYLPAWKGLDQTGVFGAEVPFLKLSPQTGATYFVIYEPTGGIPQEYSIAYELYENTRSRMVKKTNIGTFVVEQRIFTNEIGLNIDDIVAMAKSKFVTDRMHKR